MWSSDRVSAAMRSKTRYANSQARGFRNTRCLPRSSLSTKCLARRLGKSRGTSSERGAAEADAEDRMIKKQGIATALTVALVTAGLCGVALAQQGWAPLQTIKTAGPDSGINSVYYDGDEIWVVGAHGLIARSFDDGQSFQDINQGVDAGLNDVYMRRDRICIVGDGGTILRSTDSGRSFVKILRSTRLAGATGTDPDLYSVQSVDDNRVYIVGDRGLILASTDGGASWREQHSGSDAQLFHLSFRGDRGWVIGTGGTILHTDNGGRNWYPQRSGVNEDLNRVFLLTVRGGVISGEKRCATR